MDGAVHEGDAGREGRDDTERSFAGILSTNLQALVLEDQACLRLRRGDPSSQAPYRDRAPQTARQRAGQGPKDRREVASQSGSLVFHYFDFEFRLFAYGNNEMK